MTTTWIDDQMGRHDRPLGMSMVFMVLVFLSMAGSPCLAQTKARSLTIGFAELAVQDARAESRAAAVLVPRQLLASLEFVEQRYPLDEELVGGAKKEGEARLETARKAIALARSKRDLAALSVRDPSKRASDVLAAETNIAKAEAALKTVQTSIAQTLPEYGEAVSILRWPEHKNGVLLPSTLDPTALCVEKKLDLLVYGSMRSIGGYIAIELSLYVASLNRTVWSAENFASKDGLDELLQAFIRPAAMAIMGTDYARVVVSITPPDADLRIDEVSHSGSSLLYFSPGLHKAAAMAEGFYPASTTFQVNPGNDLFIALNLKEMPSLNFLLSSQPVGASIHLDGLQSGYTPLDIPGASFPRVARVTMPGFDDFQIVIRPTATIEDSLVVLIPSDGLSFDDRYDERKGAFYRSLGWFVASLPLPVISGGLFQTYLSLLESIVSSIEYDTFDSDTRNMLETKYYTSQTVFWVSAAASAGAAINALFKLRAYIDSAR